MRRALRFTLYAILALAVAAACFGVGFLLGPIVASHYNIPVLPAAAPQAQRQPIRDGHPRWRARTDVCVAPVGEQPTRPDCERMPSPTLFDFQDECLINQWIAAYAVTLEAAKAGNEVFFRVRCVEEFSA